MLFSTLFFDLDATLYPASNGLWELIRDRIHQFMLEEIGIPKSEIIKTRDHYWKTYGTTLEGLRIHHDVNTEDYLHYVHDIPLEEYLQPDPFLRSELEVLVQDLWVFTNADHKHAIRVLDQLGITDLFKGIVDLLALEFVVKPNPGAYHSALKIAGEPDPGKCILIDDLIPNLKGAKQQGFTTILVGQNGHLDEIDYQIKTIHNLRDVLPELWNGE